MIFILMQDVDTEFIKLQRQGDGYGLLAWLFHKSCFIPMDVSPDAAAAMAS
jgi:hypothetical protein